jgi:O-Antigen ligase
VALGARGENMAFFRMAETVAPRLTQYRLRAIRPAHLAFRAVRSIAGDALPILTWAATAIFLGFLVGFSAVILPPTGAFTVPVLSGLVLLWALPDLDTKAVKGIRTLFLIALVVILCVPNYYAIAGIGLPWISLRRLATFPLVVVFALVVSSSSAARARIVERLGSIKALSICVVGYMTTIGLSVLTSDSPPASLSAMVDAYLSWFVPFLVLLYVIKDEDDIYFILRVIAWCSLFVAVGGIVEFIAQRRIFIDIMPKFMVDALMENNPGFQSMVNRPIFRLGQYRASSIFGNALSFGEFGAMIVPFGYFFLLHPDRRHDRLLGYLVVVFGLLSVAACDSRGGWASLIVSTPVFCFLWVLRTARLGRGRMAPVVVLVAGAIGFALLFASVLFWPRIHDKVLGGAVEQASTQARWDQWEMAKPHIIANPVTGHGFGEGASTVGYYSYGSLFPTLDSLIISTLVETGVPGFVLFFGTAVIAIFLGARQYVFDPSRRGAVSGALACAIVSFIVNCLVLSEHENHTLFFLFVASIVALSAMKAKLQPAG